MLSTPQTGYATMKPEQCQPAASRPLAEVANGERARVVRIDGGRHLIQRLMSLGITTGSEVEVLHHRGGGVVVGLNGNRVALGAGVASHIQTCLLGPDGE